MNKFFFLLVFLLLLQISCKTHVQNEVEVYNNDFEGSNLAGISNGIIGQFNNSAVLGQYNNSTFILKVDNLPKHNLITISFDLYIHDNWRGQLLPDGPDIWQMLIDNALYINTTFSNLDCKVGNICPPQSYPDDYPNSNHNPRSGSYRTDLPGVCSMLSSPNGTTMYKITKTFKHVNQSLLLQCLDKLSQSNYTNPKCEKSWSVDNISIKAITL
ncbi:MAG: hypothetical protein JWQ34_542 [Mucilaginibacter sp.]|uniref:hypothetical protein n=1 Tax=Mucilaginibacter sp. TaxID=1882438 RepID=UPI0026028507|nr:hypothetical protein [Mucilaginibacter sp.]MDB5002317.1 hypothetical protein [Mucilaginibacter sp.]